MWTLVCILKQKGVTAFWLKLKYTLAWLVHNRQGPNQSQTSEQAEEGRRGCKPTSRRSSQPPPKEIDAEAEEISSRRSDPDEEAAKHAPNTQQKSTEHHTPRPLKRSTTPCLLRVGTSAATCFLWKGTKTDTRLTQIKRGKEVIATPAVKGNEERHMQNSRSFAPGSDTTWRTPAPTPESEVKTITKPKPICVIRASTSASHASASAP